ncbi:MAG TPA: hypothetical protein VES79_11530 [Solirubrobacteraceae bacterium]|nr:hypothetical protein [Solirubrobacteraceae bacterium]
MEYLIPAMLVLLIVAGAVALVVLRATGCRSANAAKSREETVARDHDEPDSERLANRPR